MNSPARGAFSRLFSHVDSPFLLSAAIGRVPQAMMAVAVLTYLPSVGANYALAGLASGAVGIGSALGAPIFGGLADRRGPKGVLLVFASLQAVAFLSLVLTAPVLVKTPGVGALVLLLVHSGLIGLCCPQIGAVARVVWRARAGTGNMSTAMSYESTIDEMSFVLGPVLVGLLASFVSPWAPLVISALLLLAMVLWLVRHIPALEHENREHAQVVWTRVGIVVVVLCAIGMISMGMIFGGTLTALLPFTSDFGIGESTGLLYGAMSLTSALAALSLPWWGARIPVPTRWLAVGLGLAGMGFVLHRVDSVPLMVLCLALLGLPVGPAMVTIFEAATERTPTPVLATIMTAMGSGIVVGTSLASSLAGALAESGGSQAAFFVPFAGGAGVLITGIILVCLTGLKGRAPLSV